MATMRARSFFAVKKDTVERCRWVGPFVTPKCYVYISSKAPSLFFCTAVTVFFLARERRPDTIQGHKLGRQLCVEIS